MSAYEQISCILAKGAGFHAENQCDLLGSIDLKTMALVGKLYDELLAGSAKANPRTETECIRKSIRPSQMRKHPEGRVDVFIRKPDGQEYYFDITTVKPNLKETRALKRKLLLWKALRLSQKKDAKVNAAIVLPYNPYEPKPYARWTTAKLYGDGELMIGREYWDFITGKPVYDDLIAAFCEVGREFRPKIDALA